MSNNTIARRKSRFGVESTVGLIATLIPILGFVFFNFFPIIVSFVAMFCDMQFYDLGSMKWNNFQNFIEVFHDPRFYKSVGITFWVASAQFISLGIALLIAALLKQNRKGSKLFLALFFIPYICSSVAVAIMWQWVFDWQHGILNTILGTDINWLSNPVTPSTLTWAIIITIIWQAPGYGIVMYRVAFSEINPALYEAAQMDGAGGWAQFRHITLPGIAPTTFFLLMAGILAGLMTFDAATILAPIGWTGIAGQNDMALTLVYYIYVLTGFNAPSYMDMPNASVISWVLFLITFIFAFGTFMIRNRRLEND